SAAAAVTVRWLLYAATFLAAGGVAVLTRLAPHVALRQRADVTRWLRRGAVAALALTIVGIFAQTALVTGLGTRALVNGTALAEVATDWFGISAWVRVGALTLVIAWAGPTLSHEPTPRGRRAAVTVAALVALASFAL